MKKRILSLILALSMVLSVLPLGAFAEGSTGELVIGSDGYPTASNGNFWEYTNGMLYLNGGTFDLSTTEPVKCEIHSFAIITGGTFNGTVTNDPAGKISGGTFAGSVENQGTITGNGTFNGTVTNESTIVNGTFQNGCNVTNYSSGTISGGTFACSVENNGTINGNGTFNGTVKNNEAIENGTFNGTVTNDAYGTISGGTFAGSVDNSSNGGILGGVFNGNKNPTNVTGGHNIKWDDAYSQANPEAKIEKVNDVSANWAPYVVVTELTMNQEVTITANTEIYSLNGYPIDGSPYTSSYPKPNDKTTVKFTMPDDKDVVLNKEITQGGDLVMEGGYPKISNGGKISCSGNGWTYSEKNLSNLSGKLTLTSNSGTFDFSYTYPQNTSKGSGAEPVACAVVTQSGVEITGGTFHETVTNSGTIKRGTFTGTVINSGTIENGTFASSVTNYGNIDSKGTFNGTVENGPDGTISNGTFKGIVTNNAGGEISGGTFKETVINSDGTISGGTFAGSVTNKGTVTGGVFNLNAKPTGVTGGYPITVDAASPGAKIKKVNDVSANWAPYAYAGTIVTITADTEIYSWNGYPINYPKPNDKTTVIFTMSYENVVLGTGELVMENGYPVGTIGNGWKYSDSTLTLTRGTFDFSSTHPQGKTPGTPTTTPVACAIEIQSGVTITDGTFSTTVENSYGTISDGTFNGTVENFVGTISGGTFAGRVANQGTITSGTFNGKVTNYRGRTISGGTFKGTVNNDYGTISGGTFAAGLSKNNGSKILGGIFNGNANLTGAYHVTVTDGSLSQVNGVDPRNADGTPDTAWDLYSYKDTTMTITASTEILSLNGQPIDESNYPNKNDKTTVTFTMPDKDAVLNRTAELEVVGGEIKSGETAKGSGRVLIGGKVEVTTKDKTQDFVGWTIAPEGIELRDDDGREVDLTSEWTFSFMMPDVSGGKLTLTANYQPFRTSLLMNADGTVNLEHVNHETYDGNEICKGDGWNVFNRGTLILEKGTYDFRYTAPTEKTDTLEAVTCEVQNKGGTIENGVFRSLVLNEVGGTITGGTFAAGLIEVPGMTGGSVTGGVFNGKTGLTNAHHVTVTDGSLLKVNGEDPLNADETTGTVTPGTAWDLYAYAGTTVTIIADTEIFSLNGKPIVASNCNSSYGSDKKTVTFTMPDDDVVLNKAITSTDLVMENGWPKDSNGGKNPCKGDGWEYIHNDPTNGDMLLLTGSNQTGGLFDFSTIGDGAAVECNVFVGKPTAITGGEFNGKVFNNSGILGGTFHGEVDNMGPGRIENGTFHGAVENNGMIENGAFHDEVKNNGTINDGTFHGKVENNSVINSGTFHGAVTDNGTISGNITGSGTLNGEPITKTEPEPEPEPTTYTVTVIGGTIDGKTSVSAKENDTLTVVLDQNDIPDGMTFDLWSISSSKLSGDINVDYRAEAMTFQMPPEDVTIRAQYRSAEIIEDAAPSPLATAATIAVGGAAAGIVVWQGVNLGVDLYLANALPQGVPVPTDRRALALLLWETAGKPEVALPTLYGDIPAEEIELQKATRWAVQNGLMDAADKKDASFFDPDHYVTKMDVFGAWLRLKKLLGTIGTSPTQ